MTSQINPRQLARTSWLAARVSSMNQIAELGGGFAELAVNGDLHSWRDLVEPWYGVARLVPATNLRALQHWRHGTVHDLAGWVLDGCHGWSAETQSVVAAGSRYRNHLPIVGSGSVRGGNIRMLTKPLQPPQSDTPAAWLQAFLKQEPTALALCVVPRG